MTTKTNIKCYLTDPEDPVLVARWAWKNCLSFITWYTGDVQDSSMFYDYVVCYEFGTESDAIWFKVVWG